MLAGMLNTNATATPIVHDLGFVASYDVTDGLSVGMLFLCECALLELSSWRYVLKLLAHKDGKWLYAQGIAYLLFNMFVLTPMIFATSARYFSPVPHPLPVQAFHVATAFVVHSLCYYTVHRAMHTPALYWCHRFHHRFNRHITPVAANAVTPVEYTIAYAVPFIVYAKGLDALQLAPDRASVHFAIWVIGLTNLFIHTPWLESLAEKHMPTWLVSTADHFAHHKKLEMNYAAPTFNIDTLVRSVPRVDAALASIFGKAYVIERKGDKRC